MLVKLRTMMRKDEKGFTLVELIVVMAILAILVAIAWPKYQNIQAVSRVKADATTAASICKAARIQEMNEGEKVDGYNKTEVTNNLKDAYFDISQNPKSGGTFELSGGETASYEVTWIPDDKGGPYKGKEQKVTEGEEFKLNDQPSAQG